MTHGLMQFDDSRFLLHVRPLHGRIAHIVDENGLQAVYGYSAVDNKWIGLIGRGPNSNRLSGSYAPFGVQVEMYARFIVPDLNFLAKVDQHGPRLASVESVREVYEFDPGHGVWRAVGAWFDSYLHKRPVRAAMPEVTAMGSERIQCVQDTDHMIVGTGAELYFIPGRKGMRATAVRQGLDYEWAEKNHTWVCCKMSSTIKDCPVGSVAEKLYASSLVASRSIWGQSQGCSNSGSCSHSQVGIKPRESTCKCGGACNKDSCSCQSKSLYCECPSSKRKLVENVAGGKTFRVCQTCKKEFK